MSLKKSEKEIKKILIRGEFIDWEYLRILREGDKERETDNYDTAMQLLRRNGVITTVPEGNYFLHDPSLGSHVGPRISDLNYVGYFTRREYADDFAAKVLCREGLVAQVL